MTTEQPGSLGPTPSAQDGGGRWSLGDTLGQVPAAGAGCERPHPVVSLCAPQTHSSRSKCSIVR